MSQAKPRRVKGRQARPKFDAEAFLKSAGAARRTVPFPKGKVIFAQGEPSDAVMYIQKGSVKISVLSRSGKEAVVAMLGPGDFFGEGALTGQPVRIGTATATTFSDRFISFMLARNIRIEADLVDQLFNSSEKRLARALCYWHGTRIRLVRTERFRRSPRKPWRT
jgi:CRP-like cAMP-binding protein